MSAAITPGPTPGGQEPDRVALARIMRALGDELQDMGQAAERVQTTLAPALLAVASDPGCRQDAQTCDRLTQRLFAAAAFLAALQPHIDHGWQVDPMPASRAVPMADLAHRLSCGTLIAQDHDSGELEMF